MAHRAGEEAIQILKTHKPDPLPLGVASTLRSIVEDAENELCVPKERKRRRRDPEDKLLVSRSLRLFDAPFPQPKDFTSLVD